MEEKFKLLTADNSPDKEKIKQYAELMMEIRKKESELDMLKGIAEEHEEELRAYVWTTFDGVSSSIYELENENIANILGGGYARGQIHNNLMRIAARKGIVATSRSEATANLMARIGAPRSDF